MPRQIEVIELNGGSQVFNFNLPTEWGVGNVELSLGLDGNGGTPEAMIEDTVKWACQRKGECSVVVTGDHTDLPWDRVNSISFSCVVKSCPVEE